MKKARKQRSGGRLLGVLLMVFALVLSVVPVERIAAEEGVRTSDGSGDFVIENGVLTRYCGSRNKTSVIIPNGVTAIGNSAFTSSDCWNIVSIQIPDSVTEIGYSAFDGASSLANINIPGGVVKIGANAFEYTPWLESKRAERADALVILNGLLVDGKKASGSVTIPDGVTAICDSAFLNWNGSGLTGIDIPDSVTSIGDYAFYKCSDLAAVKMSDSVKTIGEGAFNACDSLTGIEIPGSVTKIGTGAFAGCDSLAGIAVDGSNTCYDSREGCNAIIETKTNTLVKGCKNTVIPDSVTAIGDSAFSNCTGLSGMMIPSSVTTIGSGAFSGCADLSGITIPDSVTLIGDYAFGNCGLTSIVIPGNVKEVGSSSFAYCTGLSNVKIENGVTAIGKYAFDNCSALREITFPESVEKIGQGVLCQCSNLTDITICNKNVKLYGQYTHPYGAENNYCILGDEIYGESTDGEYMPNNSKAITIHGYAGSTAEQFAKLLDEHKAEAKLNSVTFVPVDGESSDSSGDTDEKKDNVTATVQQGSNPPSYSGFDTSLVSATVNGVNGTPSLKVEAGSSVISGYISSSGLVDGSHDFDCIGFHLSLVDEAGDEVTDFTDCTVTLPLPAGWESGNATFWVGTVKSDGSFERIAASVVNVGGKKCIRFTTTHFSEYGIVRETVKSTSGDGSSGGSEGGTGGSAGTGGGTSGTGGAGESTGGTGGSSGGDAGSNTGNSSSFGGNSASATGSDTSSGSIGYADSGNAGGSVGYADGGNAGGSVGTADGGNAGGSAGGNGDTGSAGDGSNGGSGNSAGNTGSGKTSGSDLSYMPKTGVDDLLFLKNTLVYTTFLMGALIFILSFRKKCRV